MRALWIIFILFLFIIYYSYYFLRWGQDEEPNLKEEDEEKPQ